MLASRILSRFLPNTDGNDYDDATMPIQSEARREDMYGDDPESSLSPAVDRELEALLAEDDQNALQHTPSIPLHDRPGRPRWMKSDTIDPHEVEDDVPQSLLLEGRVQPQPPSYTRPQPASKPSLPSTTETQWRKARDRQQLHPHEQIPASDRPRPHRQANQDIVNARERALWMWANVQNLDAFLLEVYQYFTDHGIWSIILSRAIYLLTTAFLFSLSLVLSSCIDYSKIPSSKATSEVIVPQCMQTMSFGKNVILWIFTFWWLWTAATYIKDLRRLWLLHEFFHHLLGIPDTDLQTVSWERVVEGLMKLRNANPETADSLPSFVRKNMAKNQSKQRMDAHDIANRLMRRDNYFIALFNKEILDLSLPIPIIGNRQFYSKSLEYCLDFCFQGFIFDDQGQVLPNCLRREHRDRLVTALRQRLRFIAVMSILMAPLNISAHCVYYFSRYYAEFRNSPSQISARAFTPLAEWKFREFNELNHGFRRRMRMAHPFADRYLDQFPRDKTHQFLQFVSLISGTLAGLLGLATLLDPELFLGFEVTPGRTAFFYISILTAIFAGARGAVPDDSEVHEPVLHLVEVTEVTHYRPARWKNQLHTNEVRIEFSALYQMKVLIFVEEIMSLVVAPFILWRNSGKRSEMIIDFFKEFTVEVEGLGHLCSFAVFDFRKHKNAEDDVAKDTDGLREEYFGTKDDKMAKSQYYFMQRLEQYDQQQGASRYGRQHYNMHLPPAFPPLSPSRQAASKKKTVNLRDSNIRPSRPHRPAAATFRSPSPQQSVLLDLNQRPAPSAGPSKRPARHSVRPPADYLSPDEGEEDQLAGMDALTTSRLIEQDSTLADSWKASAAAGKSGEGMGEDKAETRRQANGVLGLLVEYSKAHAGGKGPKIG